MNGVDSSHKKKLYAQIGMHVASKYPDLAREIVTNHLHIASTDTDLSNVPLYYECFSFLISDDPKYSNRSQHNRLFISCMMRIYIPGVYNQSGPLSLGKYGFVRSLSETIGATEGGISKIIRQVITYERIYDEFKADVDRLSAEILSCKTERLKVC